MQDDVSNTQDDEFDSAWNEATGEAGSVTEQGQVEAGAEQPAEQAQEVEAAQGSEPEATDDDPASDVEAMKQELKTWQGRKRKAQQEAEAEEARLEQLRQQAESAMQAQTSDPVEELGDGEGEGDVLDEFSEIANPILEKVNAQIDARMKPLVDNQEATQQQMLQAARDQFDAQVQSVHPDFSEIVTPGESGDSKLVSWVRQQSYENAVEYQRVMQEGTVQEVQQMLTDYKSKLNGGSGNRRQSQKDSAITIPRGNSGHAPKLPADKNDFDATWDAIT